MATNHHTTERLSGWALTLIAVATVAGFAAFMWMLAYASSGTV